jgi:hypothetical protein
LLTQGLDPIFRTNDGSNCDHDIDTSDVQGRRKAYSLLMNRAVIRIALPVPDTAEFRVVSVRNPYGCNDSVTLSMYRRPLPSTNLRFLSTLTWDGRESSTQTGKQKIAFPTNPGDLLVDLAHQSVDASNGHAQGSTLLTPQQQQAIVNFEMALTTAQAYDYRAGPLNARGATGGPVTLASQTTPAFFIGINDPLGGNPHLTPLPAIFDLFAAWVNPQSHGENDRDYGGDPSGQRASIARGQVLFNSKPIQITNVAGLNDDLNLAILPGRSAGGLPVAPSCGTHPTDRLEAYAMLMLPGSRFPRHSVSLRNRGKHREGRGDGDKSTRSSATAPASGRGRL